MTAKHCTSQISENFGISVFSQVLTLFVLITALPIASVATAQNSDDVSVNLGVLDDLDPMKTMPRLLMPSAAPARGRVVLTPPAGVDRITPQSSRVVLRPPPGAPARVTTAPTIAVPAPAPAAAAPPVSVTAPAPMPAAAQPAPATSVKEPEAPQASANPEPMVSGPTVPTQIEEVVEPKAEETVQAEAGQTAALPSNSQEISPVSITFGENDTDLPSFATSSLASIVEQMKADESLRVQLLAYASSTDGSISSVRRQSLSRALSVREFLMDQGVQSTRIEVRALGDQNEGGNPNRVDAVLEQR